MKWRRSIVIVVVAFAALGSAWHFFAWLEARDAERLFHDLHAGRPVPVEKRFDADLAVRLAYGLYLSRAERIDEARAALEELAPRGTVRFRAAVAYALGNLYLRTAFDKVEQSDARAATFAELAKGAYRRALRDDPSLDDAKYNLEAASRLLPDIEVRNAGPLREDEAARKLWPQLPGLPRGLP